MVVDAMLTIRFRTLIAVALLGFGAQASASIALMDWGIQIDGATSIDSFGDPIPSSVDTSGFDFISGLGTIDVTLTGVGGHSVDLWVDHEIDESLNSFFNEAGSVVGTAASGQSWEVDEPGFAFGDIFDNLFNSTLDDTAFGGVDDISMALGWDFTLAAGEQALVRFILSDTALPTGFHLEHYDQDSDKTIYFSSSLSIVPFVTGVPEPAVWMLLLAGLVGICAGRRYRRPCRDGHLSRGCTDSFA